MIRRLALQPRARLLTAGVAAAALSLATLAGAGCQRSPLSLQDAPYSPYERYQSLRGEPPAGARAGRHEVVPGGQKPSLRERLRPMQPY